MKPHDVIYLQNEDEEELEYWDATTWCSDKINEHDVKYLLCTPVRVAAPDLLEACRKAEEWLLGWASAEPQLAIIRAAIAKAEGQS